MLRNWNFVFLHVLYNDVNGRLLALFDANGRVSTLMSVTSYAKNVNWKWQKR